MPKYHYLDTCALAGWCCGSQADSLDIDKACMVALEQLLQDGGARLAISELTLIEVHDTLAKLVRSTDLPHYDNAWFTSANQRIMQLVGAKEIEVVAPPPKVVEHAMLLVTVASIDHSAKLKAWDATHIITAAGWARSLGERVEIVTADKDFGRFFSLRQHFSSMLDLREISA